MKKTLLFCDRCKREVDWLYEYIPVGLDGLTINLRPNLKVEICKDCLKTMLDMEQEFLNGANFKKRGE